MITIFNRRELTSTFDMAEQARVRAVLAQAGIKYVYKMTDQSFRGAHSRGGAGLDCVSSTIQHTIYVHKTKWEEAAFLIRE